MAVDDVSGSARAQTPHGVDLLLLAVRADPHDLDLVRVVLHVFVHADHDPNARLHALLESERALGDALHGPAALDAPHGAPAAVDLGHDRLSLLLDAVREV